MSLDESTLAAIHGELTPDQLHVQLNIHQQALAVLLEQRAAFGSLYVPPHVMHDIRDRHRAIVGLKLLLDQNKPSTAQGIVTTTDILLRPWLLIVSASGIGTLMAGTSVWSATANLLPSERLSKTLGSMIAALIISIVLGWGVLQAVEWMTFWRTSSWRWRWILILVTLGIMALLTWGWMVITH
jgi:hypothetical protein